MDDEDFQDQEQSNMAYMPAQVGQEVKRKDKQELNKQVLNWVKVKFAAAIATITAVIGKALPIILAVVFVGLLSTWLIVIVIENDQEYTSQVGNIDITEEWKATEDGIKTFIEAYQTNNADLQVALMKRTSEIIQWQTDYGYSAYFLVAVIFEELDWKSYEDDNSCLEELEQFFEDMNTKAEDWKNKGYTKIIEIAEDYVGHDAPKELVEEWANNIHNNMKKN